MANENGTWIMRGLSRSDPGCIHTVNEAVEYINSVGFLPLFKNDIAGFSLEEHTASEDWWCEEPAYDPWIWRVLIARSGEAAYGKFFDRKAGFISWKWFPVFANYRRDGYDFDSLWEDEKASVRQKKIMDLFSCGKEDSEYFSFEIRQQAGFGKDGEKGFEGVIANLQMQTYLCIRDFRERRNRHGETYGWPITVYCTPEHLRGYEYISSFYGEDPACCKKRIVNNIKKLYGVSSVKI